jgi:hypothetical protein
MDPQYFVDYNRLLVEEKLGVIIYLKGNNSQRSICMQGNKRKHIT